MKSIIIVIVIIGLAIGGYYAFSNSENDSNTTTLDYRNDCGDDVCTIICDASAVNGICRSENPNNCPQDCSLVCEWKSESQIGPADALQNRNSNSATEQYCDLAIMSKKDKSTWNVTDSTAITEYSCENNTECPVDHECSEIKLESGIEKICITNPQ